ncbi:MAG: paraquat-inducible protein A [Crocinitomicaceae bacterium]|nr:paraquat-inducible protein A [Crocinitomicaceae bacterium]
MKNRYVLPGILLSIVFLIVAGFFISRSVAESGKFKESKNEIVKILNFNDRLLSFRDWVFSEAAWEEKKEAFDAVNVEAEAHYQEALRYGYYVIYSCLAFFVIMMVIYARRRLYFGITFALSIICFSLIGEGVLNPILEIAAFKEDMTIKVYVKPSDIPYFEDAMDYLSEASDFTKEIVGYIEYIPFVGGDIAESSQALIEEGEQYLTLDPSTEIGFDKVFPGYTYFYYQNKGIMDVIKLLWQNDNKLVASAIGTFSVIIPAIKLIFTLIILLFPITGWKKFRKVLSYIAKWSMADVFVVSAFLAFLSFANMSTGVEMDASVLFGLYYFGSYVIISIVLGFLLDRSIKEKIALSEAEETQNALPKEGSENELIE